MRVNHLRSSVYSFIGLEKEQEKLNSKLVLCFYFIMFIYHTTNLQAVSSAVGHKSVSDVSISVKNGEPLFSERNDLR
jgi:hypothetical protein